MPIELSIVNANCLLFFRPERGLKCFIPKACEVIDQLIKDGAMRGEKIDEELKFNILILAEVTTQSCVDICGLE